MKTQSLQVLRLADSKDKANKGVALGELQVDLPKTCVKQLQQLVLLCNHVLEDGKISYGEYLRLTQALQRLDRNMLESRRLQKMASMKPAGLVRKAPESPGLEL